MSTTPGQLTLDLPVEPRFGAEDFLVSSSNEAAYAAIEAWPNWPDPVLVLTGPPGSGKSHLSAIWADRAGARRLAARALALADVQGLSRSGAVLLEDAGAGLDEARLFHFLNLAREAGCFVLISAASPPDLWGLATPDLLSRLRLAPLFSIESPDEALIRAVLVKLFVDRQLVVDTSVVDYVALRIDRSLEAARTIVAQIDRESLARGKRITRAVAAEMLRVPDDQGAA